MMNLTTKTNPATGETEDAEWWGFTKTALGVIVGLIVFIPVVFGPVYYAGWVYELIFGVPIIGGE